MLGHRLRALAVLPAVHDRGGRRRWSGGCGGRLARIGTTYGASGTDSEIGQMLSNDPVLAEYLNRHAAGFERDADGILWLENLLLAAGL